MSEEEESLTKFSEEEESWLNHKGTHMDSTEKVEDNTEPGMALGIKREGSFGLLKSLKIPNLRGPSRF